jgi:hypothetical protein
MKLLGDEMGSDVVAGFAVTDKDRVHLYVLYICRRSVHLIQVCGITKSNMSYDGILYFWPDPISTSLSSFSDLIGTGNHVGIEMANNPAKANLSINTYYSKITRDSQLKQHLQCPECCVGLYTR